MKRFLICLLAVIMLFNMALPKVEAHAEVVTLTMITGAVIAIGVAAGITWSMSIPSGVTMKDYVGGKVTNWLNGRSLTEAFGSEVVRLTAGKLIVPAQMVNAITDFLDDYKEAEGLQENASSATTVSTGQFVSYNVTPYKSNGQGSSTAQYVRGLQNTPLIDTYNASDFCVAIYDEGANSYWRLYENGVLLLSPTANFTYNSNYEYRWGFTANAQHTLYCSIGYINPNTGSGWINSWAMPSNYTYSPSTIEAQIPGAYDPPEGLNDLQEWEGTVEGGADTNIDDLLDDIFDDAASGTLEVEGEVVTVPDVPIPSTDPGVGDITDIIGGINTIEGTLEGVGEQVGEIAGTLEGIGEGIGDITEALDIPAANDFKPPALNTLFPFCIPFDLYNIVMAFNVPPEAPHVQIPFNIPVLGLAYTFDLDFSQFNGVASTVRTMEFVAFAVGLAILSSKVIRW